MILDFCWCVLYLKVWLQVFLFLYVVFLVLLLPLLCLPCVILDFSVFLEDCCLAFPCLLFLGIETKKNQRYLESLKTRNSFSGSFYVDPRGLARSLALWWTNNLSVTILKSSPNFIDTRVSFNDEDPWQYDKEGGASVNKYKAQWFLDFMDASKLIELPVKEGMFTCSNLRSDNDAIVERLDKILVSNDWSLAYPKAIGILEAAVASDHNPVILLFEGLKKKIKKVFKFESRWLLEEECHSNIREAWEENLRCTGYLKLNRKLKSTRVKLKK
ncbi:hypothetical protein V6N12_048099 [Hibiscus sabdariffa]|uniref:Uncharacterized protein n=1 Tax=Hibiscus sabdariffa TaxID=183260 RepID=A0ABR2CUV2_9ROSI